MFHVFFFADTCSLTNYQKSKVGMETTLSAAACGGGTLPLLGRDVKIDRALETKDAPKAVVSDPVAADLSSGHKSKVDRRNLYLANEGLLIGSEAQNEVCEATSFRRVFCHFLVILEIG